MTGPNPSGMSYGDDYVSARLSVDVPEGSVQSIRELTTEIDRYRTSMEAAIHAEADMSRYLGEMAAAASRAAEAQATLVQQMQNAVVSAQRMSGVPYGSFQQPFTPGMPGMGMSMPTGGMYPVRPPSMTDVSNQIGRMPSQNPSEYLNMQAQRGAITAQDTINLSPQTIQQLAQRIADRESVAADQLQKTDQNINVHTPGESGPGTESVAQRVQRASGLAGRVINELGPAGSAGSMGAMAARGLKWAAGRMAKGAPGRPGPPPPPSESPAPAEGEPGGGSPAESVATPPQGDQEPGADKGIGGMGLAGTLGKLGGVIAGATAIFGLIQKGGATIQGARNIASMRGGAAGEGFQVEARAKILAMNPFISQDQARQVYQAAMSEGYAGASGAGADNVIDFMTHNLTTMNISVADSAKMLRSTIIGDGKGDKNSVAGSVTMLQQELDTIRTLSREGVMSQPDYRRAVMGVQSTLTGQGASPQAAAQAAMVLTQAGSEDQALKGEMATAGEEMGSTDRGQMLLRLWGGQQIPPGLMPGEEAEYLTEEGKYPEAVEGVLKHFAQIAGQRDNGTRIGHLNAINMFFKLTNRLYPQTVPDRATARNLYEKLSGKSMVQEAERAVGAQPGLPNTPGAEERGIPAAPTYTPPAETGRTPAEPPAVAPGGRPTGAPSAPNVPPPQIIGGGGGGGGASNVHIDLTPDAAKLLKVLGPNPAPLTPTQQGANRGLDGYQVNSAHIGGFG